MIALSVFIAIYVMGGIVFAVQAHLGSLFWEQAFFFWQSISEGSLMAWVTIYAVGNKYIKRKVFWFMWFGVIKFIWEIISAYTGITVDNNWWVASIFIGLLLIASYLTLRREGRGNKWLSKHLNLNE